MKKAVIALFLLGLAGCAHIDTGQADYRVAESPDLTSARANKCENAECALAPTRVERRYLSRPNDVGFEKSDVISIELEQGAIGDRISEDMVGLRIDRAGEFAILANVFEFASTATEADRRRFVETGTVADLGTASSDPSDVELKLVYFGDDVRRRQTFNFSNLPLMQRSVYNGGSIGIQIVVIEVDASDGPIARMLTTLARFGQQSLPGPSEAKDLLFDLGESLFSGASSDDRFFEYRFVLSATPEQGALPQATLRPGRYVLRRSQDRETPIAWSNVRLDHNTGRLFNSVGDTITTEVRDSFYLTLNIRKYPRNTAPEFYNLPDWSTVRRDIANAASARLGENVVVERLIEQIRAQDSSERLVSLAQSWTAVDRAMTRLRWNSVTNLDALSATCPDRVAASGRNKNLAAQDVRDQVREFLGAYRQAILVPPPPNPPAPGAPAATPLAPLQESDQERVVSVVARSFVAWLASPDARLQSASAFKAAFVDVAGLDTFAIDTMEANGREALTCDDL